MRFQCHPSGKPAFYDQKYPGCCIARRDNLEGFWNGQFDRNHGVILPAVFATARSKHG